MLFCKRRVTTQCSNAVDKQKYDIFACVLLRRLEKSTQGQCVRIGRHFQGVWEDGHHKIIKRKNGKQR